MELLYKRTNYRDGQQVVDLQPCDILEDGLHTMRNEAQERARWVESIEYLGTATDDEKTAYLEAATNLARAIDRVETLGTRWKCRGRHEKSEEYFARKCDQASVPQSDLSSAPALQTFRGPTPMRCTIHYTKLDGTRAEKTYNSRQLAEQKVAKAEKENPGHDMAIEYREHE